MAPYGGRVYDPCWGSRGMFVSSEKFIEEHRRRLGDINIHYCVAQALVVADLH